MKAITIRIASEQDKPWIEDVLKDHWGSTEVVSRGRVHHAGQLPAFVAERDGERLGTLIYHLDGEACEIVTLNSLSEGRGVGTALLQAVRDAARETGCKRLWLITTNDNVDALRFYQKRGFCLVALHRDAILESRALKPNIPETGRDSIPIRDEIELEMRL
jgi:N-acetylglutamate synthase-like GNAT family acetyltransferase